jgi:hypothetical protein
MNVQFRNLACLLAQSFAVLCLLCVDSIAQTTLPTQQTVQNTSLKPYWNDLTSAQQHALSPLLELWPSMTQAHKRKWLAISQNFPQLSNDEKSVVQGRMREWAALSPQQRSMARLNFADLKQLPQDEKRTKWEAYQALSPEEKQKLATQQPTPTLGAAPAVKPVSSNKLAAQPVSNSGSKPLPRIDSQQAAPTTLLPPLPNTTSATSNPATTSPPESPVSSQ